MAVTRGIICTAGVSWLVALVFCSGHYENVALNKECSASSEWPAGGTWPKALSNLAVDNNTNGTFPAGRSCIHTKNNDHNPWWQVDLGRPYPVYKITVWARTNFQYRMKGCVISVDGAECYKFTTAPTTREIPITCSSGVLNGTEVRVAKKTSGPWNDNYTINICEFQVFSCSDDYWGSGCNRRCGYCKTGKVCDKVTGHCSSCSRGWKMPLCSQACSDGTYGTNCNRNCSRGCGDVCDKKKGTCTCKPGWTGDTCDTECSKGQYGKDCAHNCSAHCEDICDTATGACNCTLGYSPPNCINECENGFYGHNCKNTCNKGCAGSCEKTEGNCTCQAGWQGPTCDTVLTSPKTEDASTGIITGAAVAVGVLLLVLVAVAVVCFLRRRHSPAKGPVNVDNAQHSHHVSPGCSDDIYQNTGHQAVAEPVPDNHPGIPTKPKRGKNKSSSPAATDHAYVNTAFTSQGNAPKNALSFSLDPSCSGMAGSAVSDYAEEEPEETEDEAEMEVEVAGQNEDTYYNDDVYMMSEATDVKLDATQLYLLDKLRGNNLVQEFKGLPVGLIKDHSTGADKENNYRNRFRSILPYDENRVVLRGVPDPGSNDYINASYVHGRLSSKQYIAAQGPRPNTVGDFWKMVWQDKVTHIIMLTNLAEGKKAKCALYWPTPGKREKYGSVDVNGREVCERANYIIRTFDIKVGTEASRHLIQYHYTTWPDHGVPSTTALVDLWRTVRHSHSDQQSPSPLLVHCSAGVGRTGTYIALDTVMDKLKHQTQPSGQLDVLQVVKDLRHCRCTMVQAKSQYVVLHEALLEAYSSQGCRLSLLTFDTMFSHHIDPNQSNGRIDTQFLKLKQMKVLLHKPSHTAAEHEDNINKNRHLDVLPDDRHLARTLIPVDGRNDYINAVRVQTLGNSRGYLLTQLPLADTMVDLWRLVIGSKVSLIVSLGSDADESERKHCYWPRKQKQCVTFGPISVQLTSLSTLGRHLTRYSLSVTTEGVSGPTQVMLLHYTGWAGELPGSLLDFLHLLDCVQPTEPPTSNSRSPVLLQCKNGASKSGLFVTISDVISQVTTDRIVDVYMAVRNLHMVRPECMISKVQYRYVFTTVQEYRNRNYIYNNA